MAESNSAKVLTTPTQVDVEQAETTNFDVEKDAAGTEKENETGLEPAAADDHPGAKAGLILRQFWIVMFGLNCGMFLTALDFNIVSPAANAISSQFGAYDRSAWLGTGYLISFALVMPFYGKLGEVLSRRSLFILGTLLFILGSGLCGDSNSMNMLIASRVVQGLGGGGVYSLVNVIVTDLVPLKDVGKYLSFTGLVWAR